MWPLDQWWDGSHTEWAAMRGGGDWLGYSRVRVFLLHLAQPRYTSHSSNYLSNNARLHQGGLPLQRGHCIRGLFSN